MTYLYQLKDCISFEIENKNPVCNSIYFVKYKMINKKLLPEAIFTHSLPVLCYHGSAILFCIYNDHEFLFIL